MLKIANVTWKGRCATHPRYNPAEEGEAGIRGGCRRCYSLLAIAKQHADLMRAVREFGAFNPERKRRTGSEPAGLQQCLF